MKTIYIKPAEGRLVLMPELNYARLPAEGASVVESMHYVRALLDGDAIEVTPQPSLNLNDGAQDKRTRSGKE